MSHVAILVIKIYRAVISPWLPASCRFTPSCSAYGLQAYKRFGFIRGTRMTVWRLIRCNPWNPGGHDPVSES